MVLIGNDIVDLDQAAKDSDWTRPRYLDKLFTTEEQFLISSGIYPEQMIWLLWSMKESAYKINSRQTKLRSFAPVKLCCGNLIIHEDQATGLVKYNDQLYFTVSTITTHYIHTIAALNAEALKTIKISISCPDMSDHTSLKSGYDSTNPASVSHHGQYLALAYG